ncbi:acyl-CoA dehydrogenase family protein [Planctomycetes bacterium K23_9]|uniref:Acyl-CoA dehydrogenase n=1 Tax=Stieleria marina TaxID=1930275 RepID=A0A517NS76_9BACT|nr:Acyl-CoA dehydrogenase [Planctomycetes bacterium K23_9]
MSDLPSIAIVSAPTDPSLEQLAEYLSDQSSRWSSVSDWPLDALQACAAAGVYRWFIEPHQGGVGWNTADQTRGYLRLAQADLTTTFVITQYMGAIRRIAGSGNQPLINRWLPSLLSGESFGTVGISHLTTSRQHLRKPVMSARQNDHGFILNGMAPWVTGVAHADVYVVGAAMDDGRELLAAVPRDSQGVQPGPGISLVALSASVTDRLEFDHVQIDESMLIAGPVQNVMQSGVGGRTGGLQTSTLAIGLARAAITFLSEETTRREELTAATRELTSEVDALESLLLLAVSGAADCDTADIRGKANRLVLRSTQAALTAAKGAGYVNGHPVGRWCQQALFFLVWSCPQAVSTAHLCELAGIES